MNKLLRPAFVVALALLALSALGMGAAIKAFKLTLVKLPIYPQSGLLLNSIPRETASWIAIGPDRLETDPDTLKSLGTNNYVTRTYAKKLPDGKPDLSVYFEFHAAYYTGMIDTVPHVPDRCFVAGGMQLGELTRDLPIPLSQTGWHEDENAGHAAKGHLYWVYTASRAVKPHLPRDPQNLKLHSMSFVNRGHNLYAGYFFIANGGAVPRAEDVRLLAFDLHSTYAYYTKVQFTSDKVTSEEELAECAGGFLDEVFGDLMQCLPDWPTVEAGDYPPGNPAKKQRTESK